MISNEDLKIVQSLILGDDSNAPSIFIYYLIKLYSFFMKMKKNLCGKL